MGACCGTGNPNNPANKYRVDTNNIHVMSKHEFKEDELHLNPSFDELTTSKVSITNVYMIDKKNIGVGYFGEVKKAKLINNPTKFFAIKTIDKQKIRKEMHI